MSNVEEIKAAIGALPEPAVGQAVPDTTYKADDESAT